MHSGMCAARTSFGSSRGSIGELVVQAVRAAIGAKTTTGVAQKVRGHRGEVVVEDEELILGVLRAAEVSRGRRPKIGDETSRWHRTVTTVLASVAPRGSRRARRTYRRDQMDGRSNQPHRHRATIAAARSDVQPEIPQQEHRDAPRCHQRPL